MEIKMKDGFIKVAVATPEITVNNTKKNSQNIIKQITEAASKGAKIVVFPELCITGYTIGDLVFQSTAVKRAADALTEILDATKALDILFAVGLPILVDDKLYNAAAVCKGGRVLGFVPKTNLPTYGEYREARFFSKPSKTAMVDFNGIEVPCGSKLIFCAKGMENLRISCEICEDMWVAISPSAHHALNGANVILNLSASGETAGKSAVRKMHISSLSLRTMTAYLYADAGEGESTTDLVFGGNNMIYQCGKKIAEAKLFENGITYGVLDLEKTSLMRRKMTTFVPEQDDEYKRIYFDIELTETKPENVNPHPFIPKDDARLKERCESILNMQSAGLRKRMKHIGLKTVTLGISGGLDSTLALLVTARTFDSLGLDRKGIIAVTMPCFGTTDRTYNNSKRLADAVGVTLREVSIAKSVTQHLEDIGASIDEHDITYENAQARERTQVLMDISNKTGGIVVGTGDLSELALGFATYNGDHMSMYGVNASVPKTLMRSLVKYVADTIGGELKDILYDVLDTPVSPELLPPDEGSIKQKTEDIVGPYEIHDFVIYNYVRFGFSKEKIQRLAEAAFEGVYTKETIEKWHNLFYKRFFNNQFKRSAVPDGPKVGTVSLSPRGDWVMPSDAVFEE